MFDFTTENVLNDLSRVVEINESLRINGAKTFGADVKSIFKRVGTAAVKEVATIALTALQPGTYRFAVDVQTSGSYPITYDRWAINKGKPFYVEFNVATATADGAATAALILPLLKRGMVKNNGEVIKDIAFSTSGVAPAGNLLITAENEYLRFKNVQIGKLDAAGENFDLVLAGNVTTVGKEGFGTAWFITKNLRVPTQEATRFQGEDQDERPVNGVIYTQYTFLTENARNFSGSGAVGQKVTTGTTHVLYVPSTLTATFEGMITGATNITAAVVTV